MASDRFFSWPAIFENALPRIINQSINGSSISCSMVATTACCSSIYSINTGHPPPDLASQELINYLPIRYPREITCYDRRGCPGAFSNVSLKYIQHFGVGLATDMAFMGYPNEARIQDDRLRLYIDHYVALNCGTREQNIHHDHFQHVPVGGGEVIPNLIARHPIIGEFHVYPSFEQTQSEVYDYTLTEEDKRHRQQAGASSRSAQAILIDGFGITDGGVEYYLCQNSLGPEWGVYGGHVKVARSAFFNYFYPVNPHFR